MKADHPILGLCQLLAVSPSGFYDWQQRRDHPGPRAVADQASMCRFESFAKFGDVLTIQCLLSEKHFETQTPE